MKHIRATARQTTGQMKHSVEIVSNIYYACIESLKYSTINIPVLS
jgi:hypothetical protein